MKKTRYNVSLKMFDVKPAEGHGGFIHETRKTSAQGVAPRRAVVHDYPMQKRVSPMGTQAVIERHRQRMRLPMDHDASVGYQIEKRQKKDLFFVPKTAPEKEGCGPSILRGEMEKDYRLELQKKELARQELMMLQERKRKAAEEEERKRVSLARELEARRIEEVAKQRKIEAELEKLERERKRQEDLAILAKQKELAMEALREERETERRVRKQKRKLELARKARQISHFGYANVFQLLAINYKKGKNNLVHFGNDWRKSILNPIKTFAWAATAASVFIAGFVYVSYGFQIKDRVQVKGEKALGYIAEAKEEMKGQNFDQAIEDLGSAQEEFETAQKELELLGGDLLNVTSSIPYLSKASTGKNVVEAGRNMTEAAKELSGIASIASEIKNPLSKSPDSSGKSFVEIFMEIDGRMKKSKELIEATQDNLEKVNPKDLPGEYREKFIQAKEALPKVLALMSGFENNSKLFLDILGHNGPRKYLFLFQNNHEMRATGGFIGSYGILDINDGHIRNLTIDGIYNPDGQLWEKVVPPAPVQKISAAWSTHDANWFPNFPTSAEKIAWFYEKTGGPTVDGIIALTPTVLQKMLEITGPIDMPEYDVTIDSDNFVEKTQHEVEVDYDKGLNQPKKFVADLAPKILEKLFETKNASQASKVVRVLSDATAEKHLLVYSFNHNLQQIISQQGWSGEVLPAQKDYLMVVNSNINGYKTDGIIDEKILHKADIADDGSITVTAKVSRHHRGGNSEYEWWNKVNSNYMRIYVPKGSELVSVKGQTKEFTAPPLDYDRLGFRRDPQVEQEERSMAINEESGTRIYEENGKTVFANWTYVSPQETMEIEYVYRLPFKIDWNKNADHVDSYSLLAQKQSGSIGSGFESSVNLPDSASLVWKYPNESAFSNSKIEYSSDLSRDRFLGFVLQRKQ